MTDNRDQTPGRRATDVFECKGFCPEHQGNTAELNKQKGQWLYLLAFATIMLSFSGWIGIQVTEIRTVVGSYIAQDTERAIAFDKRCLEMQARVEINRVDIHKLDDRVKTLEYRTGVTK